MSFLDDATKSCNWLLCIKRTDTLGKISATWAETQKFQVGVIKENANI